MRIQTTVEHRPFFTVVRVEGEPDLTEFVGFIENMAKESPAWPTSCALVDLRGIRSLKSVAEHQAVGEAVGRCLGHLRRMASVVLADRLTRASEKTAQLAGVNLRVFTSEGEAIEWLTSAEPPPR